MHQEKFHPGCRGCVSVFSLRCFGIVLVMSRSCFGVALLMSRGWRGDVSVTSRCGFGDVSVMSRWCFRGVLVMSWWCFSDVSVICWFLGVSRWCLGDGVVMFRWWTSMNILSGLLSKKILFALSLLLGSHATQNRINCYISYTVFLVGVFVLATHTRMLLIPSMKHHRLMPSLISHIIAEMVNVIQLPCCMVARNRIQCIAEPLCSNEFDICCDQKRRQSHRILQVHTDLAKLGHCQVRDIRI